MSVAKFCRKMLAAGAILACAVPGWTAETYPNKPVRIVVPFSPGGQFDIVARMLGQFAGKELGQSVIIENVAGGGGNIGAAKVANAAADGYTLLTVGGNHAVAKALYAKPGFDVLTDFTPISMVTSAPHVVLVNAAVPVRTFSEAINMAKRSPGSLSYGSPGVGTSMHLTFEMIKANYGVDVLHVPYRGGSNMLNDLAAGEVKLGIVALAPAKEFIKAGKLRPLAVTSKTRSPALPDVPSVSELGYPVLDASSWLGLAGPKNLPPEVVKRWNGIVQAFVNDPTTKAKLESMAFRPEASTPAQFDKMLRSEAELYGRVVRDNKITAD